MNELVMLSMATAALVSARAFQSQNVIHGKYLLAVLTSYAMAIGEVTLIMYIVKQGWESIPYVGTGGAIGVVTAMYLHRKYVQKIKPGNDQA